MANLVYNKFRELLSAGSINWTSDVFRVLAVRSTSTYVPAQTHDFVSDFTGNGGVECSVASYSRKTLASAAVSRDNATPRIELDCADIDFGALESGQTISALVIYKQTGGNDASPSDDPLVAWIDTASGSPGLPVVLNGGTVSITIDAEGLLQLTA